MSFRTLGTAPGTFDVSCIPWLHHLAHEFVTNVKETPKATYATLATCALHPRDGRPMPTARTVVVRGFTVRGDPIITTDIRTTKVHELLQNSNATLNWWFPITNSQFRLSGTLHLLSPSLDTPADTTASSGGTLDNGNNPLPPTLVATDWHQQRLDMFSRLPGALRAGLAAPHAPGTPLEGPAAPGPGAHQSQGALQQEGVRLQLHEQQEGAGGATATQGTPPAAAPVSGPPGGLWGPEEGSWDDAVALEHFGLLVLAVDHVDRVVLGSWPHQRWWYWTTKSADGGADGGVEKGVDGLVWHSQEVQP